MTDASPVLGARIAQSMKVMVGLEFIVAAAALLGMTGIWIYSPRPVDWDTVRYAASAGLLGAAVFVGYRYVKDPSDVEIARERVIMRLILGPVFGWLALTIFVDFSDAKLDETYTGILLWLPFLVGFSADLLVAILDHVISIAKHALGVSDEKPHKEQSPSPPSTA